MRKSPKDKTPKKGSAAAAGATDAPSSPESPPPSGSGHTKPYQYTEGTEAGAADPSSPTKRNYRATGGFRYDQAPGSDAGNANDDAATGQLSPNSQARRATGLAFNYAPGAEETLKQKAGQLSPKSHRGDGTGAADHLNGEGSSPGRSYSPNTTTSSAASAATPGKYRPIGGGDHPTDSFIAGERDAEAAIVAAAAAAAAAEPRYKRVKILVIVSRFDPKTRRIDAANGRAELADAVLDTVTGTLDTPFGVVDPRQGTVAHLDEATGRTATIRGTVDPKTGNVHVTQGVRNRETQQVDDGLGQIICVGGAAEDSAPLAITAITGRVNQTTGRIDTVNGDVEHSAGLLHRSSGLIDTKYGQIDPRTGKTRALDPKTGKASASGWRSATIDPHTGHITIVGGVADPRTGKPDNQLGHLIAIGQPLDTAVEIVSLTGKLDTKRGIIQPATLVVDRSAGLASQNGVGAQQRIDTKYGQINLLRHTITAQDPKSGKTESRDFKVDTATGQLLIRGAINPTTGKLDKDYAQILSVRTVRGGTATPAGAVDASDVIVDPKTNQIWVPSGQLDPATGQVIYTSSLVDPKSGHLTVVYGYVDAKSGAIERQVKLDDNVTKIDPASGQVFTATGARDSADEQPLFAVSEADKETGAMVTKVAKVDPKTGRLTIVRVTPIFAVASAVKPVSSDSPTKSAATVTPPRPTVAAPAKPASSTSTTTTPKGVAGASDAFIPVAAGPSSAPSTAAAAAGTPVPNPVIEVITLIGTLDQKTGKIDQRTARIERTRGLLNTRTGFVATKYGQLHPISGECRLIDPQTGAVQAVKKAHVDPFTGQITIKGVTDPRTGRVDQQLTQQVTFGAAIDEPLVEVTSLSGRYDAKRGIIDPKTAALEKTLGSLNGDNGTVRTQYGVFDLGARTLLATNARTGQPEKRDVLVDATTGQLVLRNETNPKTGKPDKDWARIVSLRVVAALADRAAHTADADEAIVDPKTNQIWTPAGRDTATGRQLYAAAQVDAASGYIVTVYGVLNAQTNEIEPQQGVNDAAATTRIDPISGQVYSATGAVDEASGEPLYAVSQVDPDSGEVYTKVGRIDARTGKLILIKILLVTRHDSNGRPQQVDPATCDVDPVTGRVRNIFNKTVYVYNMVDPVTGEIVQVDPNDPRMAGARTTVTQTMTLSGEIDEETGRIKTEYGHIDPDTGDIDPETAVRDPVTGKLILNYAQIDPSHFGKEVVVTKETVPISRDQFFDGIKHLGKDALRRDSEASSDEDVQAYGGGSGTVATTTSAAAAAGRYATAPTVVKTTTKQVLTKNEDGVTHNVEEEIRNLGTGEVVFSTQEHKVGCLRSGWLVLNWADICYGWFYLLFFVWTGSQKNKCVARRVVHVDCCVSRTVSRFMLL